MNKQSYSPEECWPLEPEYIWRGDYVYEKQNKYHHYISCQMAIERTEFPDLLERTLILGRIARVMYRRHSTCVIQKLQTTVNQEKIHSF